MTLYGQDHVDRYRASDGAEGYTWRNGTEILLLTTTGRRSGKQYTHPLIFRERDGDYLIVASKGGSPEPPAWYVNLEADPDVEVQVKADRFRAKARTASSAEKPELWRLMTEVWPDYDGYQQRTGREIPVVVLERV